MGSPAPSEDPAPMDWVPSMDAEPMEGLPGSTSFEMVPEAEEDDASLVTVSSSSWPGGAAAVDSPEASSPPGQGPYAALFKCPDCGQEPTNGWCPQCHLAKGIGMPPGPLPTEEQQEEPRRGDLAGWNRCTILPAEEQQAV